MISLPAVRLIYRAWKYRLRSDPHEIRTLRRALRPGDVAVDVGCHKGAYLYWMHARVGFEGRVVGFEPQRLLAERLRQVVADLGWRNVVVHHAGVSSQDGEMELTVPVTSSGASPGATLEVGTKKDETTRLENVRTVRLDTLFPARRAERAVRLIKVDVEGHELEVFRGAEELLRREGPALLFECEVRHHKSTGMSEVFDYLKGLGYKGLFFGPNQTLLPLVEFVPEQHQDLERSPYCNNFYFTRE